jgi:hypothetical protein
MGFGFFTTIEFRLTLVIPECQSGVFPGFAGAASIVSHIHIILISLWCESDRGKP